MGSVSEPAVAAGRPAELPQQQLSPADRRLFGKMGAQMDLFHENFRHMWTTMHTACETSTRPAHMSLRQFLRLGEDFIRYLTSHHTIEEQYVFPLLAPKMECFRETGDLITQHQGIHEGLDRFEEYLSKVRSGEKDFRYKEMLEVMDSFGGVLWKHLDAEVAALGADSMSKYWTKQEMMNFPIGMNDVRSSW